MPLIACSGVALHIMVYHAEHYSSVAGKKGLVFVALKGTDGIRQNGAGISKGDICL